MIESLSNFCTSIICTIMMIIILEMIIPEGKSKKYITFICGIVVTIVLINPILNLLNVDIDEVFALNEAEYKEYEYDENLYEKTLKESYEKILVDDIVNRLKENGYEVSNVMLKYDDSTFEPVELRMNLESDNGYIQPIKIEVSKSNSSSISKVTKNKIKNIIKENYGIEKDNIYID